MKSHLLGAVCISALACFLSTAANASVLAIEFSGVISDDIGPIYEGVASTFSVGDSFSGRYVYDTELAGIPVSQAPNTTVYNGFTELSVEINGLRYTTDTAHAEICNDCNLGTVDSVNIRSGIFNGVNNPFLSGPDVNGHSLIDLALTFWDDTATALENTDLVNVAPIFDSFSNKDVTFTFYNPDISRGGGFWGTINSISYSVVPIPPVIYLFGSGLIGLVGVIRRRA